MPDFIESFERNAKAQDVIARFANIKDRGLAMKATVQELMAFRAQIVADNKYTEEDLAAFDAKVVASTQQLLALFKQTLDSTVTLANRVTIQFDGVEVS